MNKIFHVFVSSTYVDLIEERKAVSDMIAKAGFVAEGMEIFPASSQSQMEFIEQIIDRCDYYVLILAGRYGSVDGSGTSYTELEYQYAVDKGIPVLAFLHNDLGSLPNNNVDGDRGKIDAFRDLVSENAIVDFWSEPNELAGKAIAALSHSKNFHPGVGWVRGDSVASEELLKEINDLRKKNNILQSQLEMFDTVDLSKFAQYILVLASKEPDLEISRYLVGDQGSIEVGNKFEIEGKNRREVEELSSAFDELINHHLVRQPYNNASNTFCLTHEGFSEADRLIADLGMSDFTDSSAIKEKVFK